MVDRIWHRYVLPVPGFHPIAHPQYHDISQYSRSLDQLMAWVKGSSVVIGTDGSAIHIAAGFHVPTMAVFVSIDPALRARDYPHCRVLDARTGLTNGLHESDGPAVLQEVQRIWRGILKRTELPWPDPARRQGAELQAAQGNLRLADRRVGGRITRTRRKPPAPLPIKQNGPRGPVS